MQLETLARPFLKAWATNANTSSFASRPSTVTEPTNDGVVSLTVTAGGGIIPSQMKIFPYGLGSSNDGFSLRILGWNHIGPSGPQSTPLWVSGTLAEFTVLLGAATGVAGSPVLNTELFADTIAPVAARLPDRVIAAGTAVNSDIRICNVANDTPTYIIMPTYGCEKLEFLFDQTTNTPTMNCLIAFF